MRKTIKRSSTSPKIILIRNTFPKNYGGGETYQLTLSKTLIDNHYHPIIFTSSSELLANSQKAKIESRKAPFLKFQNWSGLKNFLLPLYVLWQCYLYFWYLHQFKQFKPQSIIIQSRDDWIAATLAANRLKIQVLWIDHMDFRSWVLQNVEQKYKNLIGKKILKLANRVNRIIFISDFERHFFEKLIEKTPFRFFSNLITIKMAPSTLSKSIKTTLLLRNHLFILVASKNIRESRSLYPLFRKLPQNSHLPLFIFMAPAL